MDQVLLTAPFLGLVCFDVLLFFFYVRMRKSLIQQVPRILAVEMKIGFCIKNNNAVKQELTLI